MWTPGKQLPSQTQSDTPGIDALLNDGVELFMHRMDDTLREAYKKVMFGGVIATLPYLIAGQAMADKSSYLWRPFIIGLSEENAGIDMNGRLLSRGRPVVVIVHGGGILTPERISNAYRDLTGEGAARYTDEEFDNLLQGHLPSGDWIDLYSVDDVRRGLSNPFGRYAVWLPGEAAKAAPLGGFSKANFMSNELVIARAGTIKYLDAFFENAKNPANLLENTHYYNSIYFEQPQGRLLSLVQGRFDQGINGQQSLDVMSSRFIIVPEKQ